MSAMVLPDQPTVSPVCPKCGREDVLIRWHEQAGNRWQRPIGMGDKCSDLTEHLHYHCRTCQYGWTGPLTPVLPMINVRSA